MNTQSASRSRNRILPGALDVFLDCLVGKTSVSVVSLSVSVVVSVGKGKMLLTYFALPVYTL